MVRYSCCSLSAHFVPFVQSYDVVGPTSAAHLLHSQGTISSRMYESYDLRYHYAWEVSNSGDGLIRVEKPATEEQQPAAPRPADLRLERDVIEKLLNTYFSEVGPILPVVTKAELLATPSPPPILLYSMCLVAAGCRGVPQAVFDSLRYVVNALMKAEDISSTSSIVNVQALLILCMMGDCHSQYVPSALSAMWIRLGAAIRMVSATVERILSPPIFTFHSTGSRPRNASCRIRKAKR